MIASTNTELHRDAQRIRHEEALHGKYRTQKQLIDAYVDQQRVQPTLLCAVLCIIGTIICKAVDVVADAAVDCCDCFADYAAYRRRARHIAKLRRLRKAKAREQQRRRDPVYCAAMGWERH